MVPFHESDLASERWAKSEWEHIELWEKIEARLKRRRRYWIAGAIAVFLLLSAVPVWMDRKPKWGALRAARELGLVLSQLKTRAATEGGAFRARLSNTGERVILEKAASCDAAHFEALEQPALPALEGYVFIDAALAQRMELTGLRTEFCFDVQRGASDATDERSRGVGLIATPDVEAERWDRIAVLFWQHASGELTFE